MPEPFSFISTPIIAGEEAYNNSKFIPLYMIPIIGSIMYTFHDVISSIFGVYNKIKNELSVYKNGEFVSLECDENNDIKVFMESTLKNKHKRDIVKRYKLKELFNFMLKNKNGEETNSNEINSNSFKYKSVSYIFCNTLKIFSLFNNAMDNIGSVETIEDIVKTSAVSGQFALLSLIIALIVYMLFY